MSATRVRVLSGVAILGMTLVSAAGCGSGSGSGPGSQAGASSPSTSASPAVSLPPGLKQSFVASENTAMNAINSGGAKLKNMSASFTGSQLSQVLGPMATATLTFNRRLTALPWPHGPQPQVTGLIAANQAWVNAATRLEKMPHVTKAAVRAALAKEFNDQVIAVDRLRGAIGLSPL